ncbi:hypothetical protein FRC01_009488 [Tulasnella sp. 417]|nr:hypothetical protein FRC01_009488 [Tulasnella sp. 417]
MTLPFKMTNGTVRAGPRMNSLDSDPEGSLRTSLDSDYRTRFTATEKGKSKPLQLEVPRLAVNIQPPTPTMENTSPVSQTTTSKGDHSPTSTDPHASTPVSIESFPAPIKSTSPNPEPPTLRIEDTTQKGCTDYVPLKDHTVRWNHTVDVNVDFKIKRETHELMPCELKLVLQERLSPNGTTTTSLEPVAPTRFGIARINLAEYADRGPVTRRYLLDQSNTNAQLKLTVHAERVSGDKNYKVPDLKKGQAVAGVAGVLANDPLRNFMNFSDVSASSQPGISPRPSSPRSLNGSTTDLKRPGTVRNKPSFASTNSQLNLHRWLVDPSQHSAENIIEAIFNPTPTSSTSPSPFTYYVPAPSPGIRTARPSTGTTLHSMDESSKESESLDGSSIDHSVESGVSGMDELSMSQTQHNGRGWWSRLNKKPATPSTGRKSSADSASIALPSPTRLNSEASGASATSAWTDVANYPIPTTPAA